MRTYTSLLRGLMASQSGQSHVSAVSLLDTFKEHTRTDNLQQTIPPQHGPPFPPTHQALGEVPTIGVDVPVNAVFLCLFIAVGAAHALLLRRNTAAGKKFLITVCLVGMHHSVRFDTISADRCNCLLLYQDPCNLFTDCVGMPSK